MTRTMMTKTTTTMMKMTRIQTLTIQMTTMPARASQIAMQTV